MISKSHHFFFLLPNFWPVLASFVSLNFLFSIIFFFKFNFFLTFFFSMFNMVNCSFFWWICYIKEFHFIGSNSNLLEFGLKFSMILFISSEIFLFFSFFWSYFHFFLSPDFSLGQWPSFMVLMFDCLDIPLLNTLILLSSGVFVTLAHKNLVPNVCIIWSSNYIFLTMVLGIFFTFFQFMEYCNSFFSISDSSFGSSFFVLTGFHGAHVLIGTIFLMVSFIKNLKLSYNFSSLVSFELASWYWHFVDVVWIFLYFFIYYLN